MCDRCPPRDRRLLAARRRADLAAPDLAPLALANALDRLGAALEQTAASVAGDGARGAARP